MPQEPKKRHSRARQGKRRASIHLGKPRGIKCPNCGAPTLPHQVCKKCGYYKGREIVAKTKVIKRKTDENAA
ncbi:MAG TPA: 50S ribosomal protein L32 [Candidatus Saccharimonadales bacterium]|nr:50S ribosomal protein L32 [Candidatus Saccharimonadales bacterium]